MPIQLRAEQLEPGMRVARPLIGKYHTLVTVNHALTQKDIDLLIKHRVKYVAVFDPLLDARIEFDMQDAADMEIGIEVQRKMVKSVEIVEKYFRQSSAITPQELFKIQAGIAECIEYVQKNPVVTAFLEKNDDTSDYSRQHAFNVFYLALLIGFRMRGYIVAERKSATAGPTVKFDLNPLGLGALLIDIGMRNFEALARRSGALSPQEMAEIRNHPVAAWQMLPKEMPAHARLIVKSHHENYNGTGYPDGLKGKEIQVFARIARVADAFDAATSQTVYSQAKSQGRALHEMSIGAFASYFDPVIVKVFSTLIQPFPIGAKIKLSNGMYAVVVRHNPDEPFNPQVIIAFDAEERALAPYRLEEPFFINARKGLKMIGFAGEDLSYLYQPEALSPIRIVRDEITDLFGMMYP